MSTSPQHHQLHIRRLAPAMQSEWWRKLQPYPWEDRDYYKLMPNKVVGSCKNCHLVSFNCLIGGSVPRGAGCWTVKLSARQCHLQPPLTALTRLPWNWDTSVNVWWWWWWSWWWWWCDRVMVCVWPDEEEDNGDQPMIRDQWGAAVSPCLYSLYWSWPWSGEWRRQIFCLIRWTTNKG